MVTLDPEFAQPKQQEHLIAGDAPHSSHTTLAPPPFEQSTADPVVLHFSQPETYTAPGGEDPPLFTPYEASYFVSGVGDVISHDPHLNEDVGEALYRFLLSQAVTPPQVFLRCQGSHCETHTRFVHSQDGDQSHLKTEEYTRRVVDFDFKIDIGQHIFGEPTHWSIGDTVPAYRGRMFREVGVSSEKRKAKKAEVKSAKVWDSERESKGFPPWVSSGYAWREDQPHIMDGNSVLKSSWTLRQWADDFCSSRRFLKEFEYRKVVYGWNFDALKAATRSVIVSTHYLGDLEVSLETINSMISVRSHNHLSRALSNGWIKFLLIITLIYPFLWLFRRFHHRGGGIWRVCGGAYALKRVEGASDKTCYSLAKNAGQASGSSGSSDPSMKVIGLREGVWFRQWEGTIRRAVRDRLQRSDPLLASDDPVTSTTTMLDGY
ncbi:hypothetical protein JVU11DRAFT_5128 [Chiua virens]|nr:hypothetical protein JVU11DRAFT_5128 [Chiua virens]